MNESYRNDFGFVYEYGYNIGQLSALMHPEEGRPLSFPPELQKRLTGFLSRPDQSFANFVIQFRAKHRLTDEGMFAELRQDLEHLFYFGFVSGQYTASHYLRELPIVPFLKTEVVFVQMNLFDPLQRGHMESEAQEFLRRNVREAFGYDLDGAEYGYYERKGHFLNADSLLLLRQGKRHFLLVTDNKLTLRHLEGVRSAPQLLASLSRVHHELARKTKFSHVSFDTEGLGGIKLDRLVLQYAQAVQDHTLVKSVQAGAYAYSFLSFFTSRTQAEGSCQVSLMGQNDYDYSVFNLPFSSLANWSDQEHGRLLKACHDAYAGGSLSGAYAQQQALLRGVQEVVLNNLLRNTRMDRDELLRLVRTGEGSFSLEDSLGGFQNTAAPYEEGATFRDDHAREVARGLNDPAVQVLFLTGNPGIGKTTVIANELRRHPNFLFLYTSCRRTVNDDILDKFSDGDRFYADDLVALSTSSTDEQRIGGEAVSVVNYAMNDPARLPVSRKLTYLDKRRTPDYERGTYSFRARGDDELVEEMRLRTGGVLSRLCDGLKEQLENRAISKIIATFSIQALKRTKRHTTIRHLQRLFPFVRHSDQMGTAVDQQGFDAFVRRHPVCWVMIDEITGSDEGVALYQAMRKWLLEDVYAKLTPERQKKWNVKLIVADASITSETIVSRTLHSVTRFDHPKIYITKGEGKTPLTSKALSVPVSGGSLGGWLVNSNSYPAPSLRLTYHVTLKGFAPLGEAFGESAADARAKEERLLEAEQDEAILSRVFAHLSASADEQVIVYVQNIKRLQKMAASFSEHYEARYGKVPVVFEDYMVISSQLTQSARARALASTRRARVVFMTSSAVRGISFPMCTKILAVLQTWNIEKELMEQIQLHYRMRGHREWDAGKEKHIEFFALDTFVHYRDDRPYKQGKAVIHMLSLLTLVRACLESRALGETTLASQQMSVVPLGGAGISPVKHSLIQDVADALKLMTKELSGKGEFHLLAQFKQELMDSFGAIHLQTKGQIFSEGFSARNLYPRFIDRARRNVAELLAFRPFCPHWVINGMVVFQVPDTISENVSFLLHQRTSTSRLIGSLQHALGEDLTSDLRKKLVHILELLRFEQARQGYLPNTFVEESQHDKRYVALPLMAFPLFEPLKEHVPKEGDPTFLEILPNLVRAFADVSSVTPIQGVYKNIPFITFKSDALAEMAKSQFLQNHVLTSTETNLLNLLLMAEEMPPG